MLNVETYRRYCIDNDYFTCGNDHQYKRALKIAETIPFYKTVSEGVDVVNELAVITWICSDTRKEIKDIFRELVKLWFW